MNRELEYLTEHYLTIALTALYANGSGINNARVYAVLITIP